MNYKLFKLQLGTSRLVSIMEFQSPFEITEFCYIEGYGFILLFKSHHCLGHIDKSNKLVFPLAGEPGVAGHRDSTNPLFEFPSSVCYSDFLKKVFIIEKGGARIREIEVDPFYGSSVFGRAVEKKMEVYFANLGNISGITTFCCIDDGDNIYWSVRELNRCFKYNFALSDFEPYVGNGRYGFSISSDFHSSIISSPSGMLYGDGHVFIADSGNHCLRDANNNKFNVVAGYPCRAGYRDDLGTHALLDNPTKMVILKNLICFMDINRVRYYTLSDHSVGTLYNSPHLVSIESDEKDLWILEKVE